MVFIKSDSIPSLAKRLHLRWYKRPRRFPRRLDRGRLTIHALETLSEIDPHNGEANSPPRPPCLNPESAMNRTPTMTAAPHSSPMQTNPSPRATYWSTPGSRISVKTRIQAREVVGVDRPEDPGVFHGQVRGGVEVAGGPEPDLVVAPPAVPIHRPGSTSASPSSNTGQLG